MRLDAYQQKREKGRKKIREETQQKKKLWRIWTEPFLFPFFPLLLLYTHSKADIIRINNNFFFSKNIWSDMRKRKNSWVLVVVVYSWWKRGGSLFFTHSWAHLSAVYLNFYQRKHFISFQFEEYIRFAVL